MFQRRSQFKQFQVIVSLVAVLFATGLLACAVLKRPKGVQVLAVDLDELDSTAHTADKVIVPVTLKVINPNDEQLELSGEKIRVVTKDGKLEHTLGVASFEAPVLVGPGRRGQGQDQQSEQLVDAILGIDRQSWHRSILKEMRDGNAYVVGPVSVIYGGRTYKTTLDFRVPGRQRNKAKGTSRVLSIDFDLKSLDLEFRAMDDLHVVAKLEATSDIGQKLSLKDVELAIGAKGTRQPLLVALDRTIELPGHDRAAVLISGSADLAKCDPSLLDDIENNRGRAEIRLRGVAFGQGVPQTDVDETFSMNFKPGRQRRGPEVSVQPPSLSLVAEIIGAAHQGSSVLGGLHSVLQLKNHQPAPVRFSVDNPLPGTITIERSRFSLFGPYNVERDTRLEITTLAMDEQALSPRARTNLEAVVQLSEGAVRAWKSIAVDVLGSNISDYCYNASFAVRMPVFGRIEGYDAPALTLPGSPKPCGAN